MEWYVRCVRRRLLGAIDKTACVRYYYLCMSANGEEVFSQRIDSKRRDTLLAYGLSERG